jgi:hypothetical protein
MKTGKFFCSLIKKKASWLFKSLNKHLQHQSIGVDSDEEKI